MVDRKMRDRVGLFPGLGFLARRIADNAPLSVRAAKLAVNEAVKGESERDAAAVQAAVAACFDSADYRQGRTAFMEKRKPKFTGS